MKLRRLVLAPIMIAVAVTTGYDTRAHAASESKSYPSPKRFENSIQAFEARDKVKPPPEGAIVCTGSSSMLKWHKMIAADLAPLTVIPRGFGGSNMNDLLYFADRVILRYKPRAVVIYEGDNDTAQKVGPEKIRDTFVALVKKVRESLPETRIYFLAIKPSVSRKAIWPVATRANELIAEACSSDPQLIYVDIATPMMDEHGNVRTDIFIKDNLHMNRTGYEIWRKVLRPILMKGELQFEKKKLSEDAAPARRAQP